jgi:hypothetical protein
MNESNLIGLKMIQKRDGIKAGSFLHICRERNRLVARYKKFEFTSRWIELAIKQGKAKAVYRAYALV